MLGAKRMILHEKNPDPPEEADHDCDRFHGHDHKKDRDESHERLDHHHGHTHTHGSVDPSILTTERGIRAVKWSFAGLFITAIFQIIIVSYSGSIALLADTIHNFGDALTAIPLLFAFMLARVVDPVTAQQVVGMITGMGV